MVLLEKKVGLGFGRRLIRKFPVDRNSRTSTTAALHGFRSKIFDFAGKLLLKPSLSGLKQCFDLIDFTSRAFSEMVAEIDYPMSRWGSRTAEEYFTHTLSSLHLLNSITAAVLRLRHAKISIPHTLETITSYSPSGDPLERKTTEIEWPRSENDHGPDPDKDRLVLEAVVIWKEITRLSLGLVLSGLCSDWRIYTETRESIPRFEDPVVKNLDLRFSEEMQRSGGTMEEVKEVNGAIEGIIVDKSDEAVEKLEVGLQAMEREIEGIEKEVDSLFSDVLAARNKLIDRYRDELSKD